MQRQIDNLYSLLTGSNTATMQQIGVPAFLFLLVISLASSLAISYLYTYFYSTRATGSHAHRSFPLLGISITAIFVCIQFSLPLSLGLLGALSIVRFRTPIKEPEEIGFIMLVIAASIACATFKLAFVGILFAVAIVALLVQNAGRLLGRSHLDGVLVVAMPEEEQQAAMPRLNEMLMQKLPGARLESLARNDGRVIVSYNFQGAAQPVLLGLQAEIAQAARGSTLNVFFSRPGAL
jgi:hypothetical protein